MSNIAIRVENLSKLYAIVKGFRWALLGIAAPPSWSLVVSTLLLAGLLVTGAFYFRRTLK
jgi:ABC-type polysaccharide/polyol phosphate export permease